MRCRRSPTRRSCRHAAPPLPPHLCLPRNAKAGARLAQLALCKEQVEWTKQEKRTFLRHRVELRLAAIYLSIKDYSSALPLISACAPCRARLGSKINPRGGAPSCTVCAWPPQVADRGEAPR